MCDISGWFSRLSLSALQRAHPCSSVISNTTDDWAWLWTPEPWMKPTKISSYFPSYASHGSLNTDNKSSFFLLCMKCQWVLNIFYEQRTRNIHIWQLATNLGKGLWAPLTARNSLQILDPPLLLLLSFYTVVPLPFHLFTPQQILASFFCRILSVPSATVSA